MTYDIAELENEIQDQCYNLAPPGSDAEMYVVDHEDIITAIGNLKKELQDYIKFVDGLRTHGKPKEVLIKYEIYKKLLGEK